MSDEAAQNLRENQQQMDMDGIMVGVSRQALDEVLAERDRLVLQRDHHRHIQRQGDLKRIQGRRRKKRYGDMVQEWKARGWL